MIPAHVTNYTVGRNSKIRYLVIHYTGNDGDTAEDNCRYFQQPGRRASAHYFVDDTEWLQSVQDTDTAWHCGANSYCHPECRNGNSLGIELCSRKDAEGNYYFTQQTVEQAVKLVRLLKKIYGIPDENVIRHYDVTGKCCPAPFVKNSVAWKYFLQSLEEANSSVYYNSLSEVPAWGQATVEKLLKRGLLLGTQNGLELDRTMLRLLVIHDRAGLYD